MWNFLNKSFTHKQSSAVITCLKRGIVGKDQINMVHREPQNAHMSRHWTLHEIEVEAFLAQECDGPSAIAYEVEALLHSVKGILF